MKKSCVSLFCALLGAVSTYGQVRFEAGPQLGLNAGTARYHLGRDFDTKFALNGQVGAAVNLGWRHWELQAAALFAQKGFRVDDDYTPANFSSTNLRHARTKHTYRLDYLTLPVNQAYSLRADGQGLQRYLVGAT